MTQAIVFSTPELIDIRAFTTFGINAKPLSKSPIGFFGTGLKYAIAVLVREGIQPILYIGKDKYTFFKQSISFRDKEFPLIRMKKEKWQLFRYQNQDLPFTCELGKNWKLWQAFRELESNTRDEGGSTSQFNDFKDSTLDRYRHNTNQTLLVIEDDRFVECFNNINDIFLQDGLSIREDGQRVQIIDRPSKFLYYRGMRVTDLDRPTMYTYNFLSQLELTEDRTLKFVYMARTELARQIVQSNDERLIEKIITAGDSFWEYTLEFDYQSDPPGDAFRRVMERRRGAASRSALRYYGGFAPLSPSEETTWELHPRPWTVHEDQAIFDAKSNLVLAVGYEVENKEQLLIDVCDLINKDSC